MKKSTYDPNALFDANTFDDGNDPIKSYTNEYILLWRNVVIRALRDSCDCAYQAMLNANWAKTEYFKEVCEMAFLDEKSMRNKLISIHKSPEVRQKTFEQLKYFKTKMLKGKKTPKFVHGKRTAQHFS